MYKRYILGESITHPDNPLTLAELTQIENERIKTHAMTHDPPLLQNDISGPGEALDVLNGIAEFADRSQTAREARRNRPGARLKNAIETREIADANLIKMKIQHENEVNKKLCATAIETVKIFNFRSMG